MVLEIRWYELLRCCAMVAAVPISITDCGTVGTAIVTNRHSCQTDVTNPDAGGAALYSAGPHTKVSPIPSSN
jgi:hypothetical protein